MTLQIHRFTIGAINAIVTDDFPALLTSESVRGRFPNTPDDILNAFMENPDNPRTSCNILYLESGGRRILVDTGHGALIPDHHGHALANLTEAGVDVSAIDTVIITHFHGDHFGGMLDANQNPVFPNAQIVAGRAELNFWLNDPTAPQPRADQIKHLAAIYAGKIREFDDGDLIAPDVRAVLMPGHTPGQMGLLIENGADQLLHFVDAIHMFFQLDHPEQSPRFDAHPDQAAATRRAMLARAADQNLQALMYHFPFPGLGRVTRKGDAFAWVAESAT